MSKEEIILDGIAYISSKRAAQMYGYTQDYVGQLARSGKVESRRVSGLWYIQKDSLSKHKKNADLYTPTPPQQREDARNEKSDSMVGLDGKTYISASRASKLTGYHQDYIGQLARSGKVLSQQIGNRWYVHLETLKSHKSEKDKLLASVQAESVGVVKQGGVQGTSSVVESGEQDTDSVDLHFAYSRDERPLNPHRESQSDEHHSREFILTDMDQKEGGVVEDEIVRIPIHTKNLQENESSFAFDSHVSLQDRPYRTEHHARSRNAPTFRIRTLLAGVVVTALAASGYFLVTTSMINLPSLLHIDNFMRPNSSVVQDRASYFLEILRLEKHLYYVRN